jgi:16S rRNA C967 or C1407 C5-methylase (RsmB/RsmF family)
VVARSKNIEKVVHRVLSDESEREALFAALERGSDGVSAVAWLRSEPVAEAYERNAERPRWLPSWIDVAAESARPGKLPAHEAGEIYVLDLSSTFAAAPLALVGTTARCVLDVCAAPGGKGILAWRYCNPEVLIANEVIRKRTAQLISNYQRCAIDPAIVCSCDPGLLSTLIPGHVDLAIVDAPCSGQSLVLKGMAAPGAFHPATIAMNERRQRRILAHSAATVRPGGYLLYATCTFSREENEDNAEWFCKKFPEFAALEVPLLTQFRSALSDLPTYRLFPHHGFGAGAFVALFRRAESDGDGGGIALTPDNVTATVWPVWRSRSVVDNREVT